MFLGVGELEEEGQSCMVNHVTYLGVALKGANLASYHRAILLTLTESPFQAHLDRVTGILVSTI